MTGLSRKEMEELRNRIAHECLAEIENGVPECDDERLGYASIQIDRQLWLAARYCPKPPFLDGWHNEQAAAEPKPPKPTQHERIVGDGRLIADVSYGPAGAPQPIVLIGEPGKPETWRPADGRHRGIMFIPEELAGKIEPQEK